MTNTDKTFSETIVDMFQNLANDEAMKKRIDEEIKKCISEIITDAFKFGSIRTEIKNKFDELMVPIIKNTDFSEYVTSVDAMLTSVLKSPQIFANNTILNNFKTIVAPDIPVKDGRVSILALFELYKQYVAENVETTGRSVSYDSGEPAYEDVECTVCIEKMHTERNNKFAVSFVCDAESDTSETMNFDFEIYKWNWETKNEYYVFTLADPKSLRYMSSFEATIYSLMVNGIKIVFDETLIDSEMPDDYSDSDYVTPEKTPEPTYE